MKKAIAIGSVRGFKQVVETGLEQVIDRDGNIVSIIYRTDFERRVLLEQEPHFPELKFINGDFVK